MSEGFSTNYTNEASKEAEENFLNVIEAIKSFDVETVQLPQSNREVVEKVKEYDLERLDLVLEKSGLTQTELEALPQHILLDRLLGIDHLFSFGGHVCAVDVATGKSSTLTNKIRKFERFEDIYKELGIEHAILFRLKQLITDDVLQEILLKVDQATREDQFIIDIRI